jgi:hypothetical protein
VRVSSNNPPTNKLENGITESDILNAVSQSGFPLQSFVANELESFQIQEEWLYIDRDTNEQRALDIMAQRPLELNEQWFKVRVRPHLCLLIECKKSNSPWVFFLSKKIWLSKFPRVAGLKSEEIQFKTNGDLSTHSFPLMESLGLSSHTFVTSDVPTCTSFSKCVRKLKEAELTGDESYKSLVFPLGKAFNYFLGEVNPTHSPSYFDARLTLGIGVVDAPMVGIDFSESQPEPIMMPWVRIPKYDEADELARLWGGHYNTFAFDVVHKDFFTDYLQKHVLPFSNQFGEIVCKHGPELASGKAFVEDLNKNRNNLESKMRPR